MTQPQQTRQRTAPPRSLLSCKELGYAAKLAAWYIWDAYCDGRPQTVAIVHARLGLDLGKSERSAERWVDTLAAFGFLEINHGAQTVGGVVAYVRNPADVIGRRGSVSGDPQRQLWREDDRSAGPPDVDRGAAAGDGDDGAAPTIGISARSSAADPALDDLREPAVLTSQVRSRARLPSEESRKINTPSPSVTFGRSTKGEKGLGGSDARTAGDTTAIAGRGWTAEGRHEPHKIAAAATDVLGLVASRLPTPEQKRAWAEQYVAVMLRAVADPLLRKSPCLRVAWSVVEGRIDWSEVELILSSLAEHRRHGRLQTLGPGRTPVTASQYFVGAAMRLFARRGVDWTSAPRNGGGS